LSETGKKLGTDRGLLQSSFCSKRKVTSENVRVILDRNVQMILNKNFRIFLDENGRKILDKNVRTFEIENDSSQTF